MPPIRDLFVALGMFFIAAIVIGIICLIIYTIYTYIEARKGCTGKISFDHFLKCYYTKDCEFGLNDGYISVYIYKYGRPPFAIHDTYHLYFSFIDFIRYMWWKWNKERNEKKLSNNEDMNKVNEYLNSKLEEHKDV